MVDVGDLRERLATAEGNLLSHERRHDIHSKNIREIQEWNKQVYAELHVLKIGGRVALAGLLGLGGLLIYLIKFWVEH